MGKGSAGAAAGVGLSTKRESELNKVRKNKVNATVIPAPRKSVKRMIFESLVNFIARLFSCESANPPD